MKQHLFKYRKCQPECFVAGNFLNYPEEQLLQILHHAIKTDHILQSKKILLDETQALFDFSGGDARKLLNALELVVSQFPKENEIHYK